MEILLYALGAVTAVGIGFGIPLLFWAKQHKQTIEMIETVQERLQFHRSYYEALQRETTPVFHTLDKRVTRSLYEAFLLLSMVGDRLEQLELSLNAPLVDLSAVRTQLELLSGAVGVIGAPGATLDLSSLAGWDGRIELRLAFVKAQVERIKVRRAQTLMHTSEIQQVAYSR